VVQPAAVGQCATVPLLAEAAGELLAYRIDAPFLGAEPGRSAAPDGAEQPRGRLVGTGTGQQVDEVAQRGALVGPVDP
jgi:hypothetical protein